MTQEDFDFAKTYAAMADDELLDLAHDSATLVESAQTALQKELDKRGLKLEPPPTSSSDDPDSAFYCPSCESRVNDPLTCGECSTAICRICGTPLQMPEDVADVSDEESSVAGTEPEDRAHA
jgi:hypothetical protein